MAAADPYGSRWRLRKLGKVRPKGMQNTFLVSELLEGEIGTPYDPTYLEPDMGAIQHDVDQALGQGIAKKERLQAVAERCREATTRHAALVQPAPV